MRARLSLLLSFGPLLFSTHLGATSPSANQTPLFFLEMQPTSSNWMPAEKISDPETSAPTVVTKALIRKLLFNTVLLTKMVDPKQGLWVISSGTGSELDMPDETSTRHLCGDTWKTAPWTYPEGHQKSIWQALQSILPYADIACHNNVERPFCSIADNWEYGSAYYLVFRRNPDQTLRLQAYIRTPAVYRSIARENAYVQPTLARADTAVCN